MTDARESKPTGRPTIRTAEVTEKLLEAIERGDFLSTAAGEAGITRATFHNWCNAARAEDAPAELREWGERVEVARQRGLAVRLRKIAASEDWKAQAWLAERMDHGGELRAPATRTELTGADGGPVEIAGAAARVSAKIDRLLAPKDE